jgi:signal transduction histidine kinase
LKRLMFVAPAGKQRVDLAAMRERLHRIGGTLEVDAVDQVVLKAIIRVGQRHAPAA